MPKLKGDGEGRWEAHLSTRNESFSTFTISTSEARSDQIGDTGTLLNESIGFGTREELEGELARTRNT